MIAAAQYIDDVRRSGASLVLRDHGLRLVPAKGAKLPPDLVERGRALKPEIIETLRAEADRKLADLFRLDPAGLWTEEDWQVAYEERAAILEYDEGLSRREAERLAKVWIEEKRGWR